jgi:4-hydroxy-4-methyl-2-oxoglutarate aldolase
MRGHGGGLTPPLTRVPGGQPTGTAVTVSLAPGRGGFGPLYEVLSGDLAGRVVVVSSPVDDVAVWGELLSSAAAGTGAAAVVVAGAVRDAGGLVLPTWARATATVGPAGRLEVACIGGPVEIGGTVVDDGDVIVVDDDGVVALGPADIAAPVLADAAAYAAAEARVAADLVAGHKLVDAYRHKASIVTKLHDR